MHLRVGTLLAIFALISQMAISLLPMPAMAEAGSPRGEMPICHAGALGAPAPAQSDKSPGSHNPDCPVCQAIHLAGSLAPPTPGVRLPEPGLVQAVIFFVPDTGRPDRVVFGHRARAPPPTV